MIAVTTHAIQRFRERVANWADEAIIDYLNGPRFLIAAAFGCPSIIMGTGQRVIMAYDKGQPVVITIKPTGATRGSMDPHRDFPSNRKAKGRQARETMLCRPLAGRIADNRGY